MSECDIAVINVVLHLHFNSWTSRISRIIPGNAPLSLAGAINPTMAVLIFIGVIKDTEGDVGLRADVRRNRTLVEAGSIGALRTALLPRFRSFALTNK